MNQAACLNNFLPLGNIPETEQEIGPSHEDKIYTSTLSPKNR